MPLIDCHNHLGVDLAFYLDAAFPYAQDASSLAAVARRLDLAHLMVFPMVSYRAQRADWSGTATRPAAEPYGVPYAFENRRLLTEIHGLFPELAKVFWPLLIVDPARDPAGQVAALTALLDEFPVCGLKIQPTIIRSPIAELGRGSRVLLDLAREHDLPFLIHSSIDPADAWSQCADILDLAEAHPEVRFCLAHSCRFHRPSLDRLAALPNAWFDCSAHIIHCECATRGLAVVARPAERFVSDYARPEQVLADLAAAYPDKLMWGSDSPFYSFVEPTGPGALQLKSSHEREVACLRALPRDVQQRIAWRNPLTYLGSHAPVSLHS